MRFQVLGFSHRFWRIHTDIFILPAFCLSAFCFSSFVWAQEAPAPSGETAAPEDVPAAESEQVGKPSAEQVAAEADEKKRSLNELLAVPFKQLKEEQAEESGISASAPKADNDSSAKHDGSVNLPPPPEQSKAERDLEKTLDAIFREMLPKEYVGVTVSIRYLMETVPVTKQNKRIARLKLPGFENNVWVPTQTEEVVGIVNQVRPYTTIFAVVNTPISLFNVEVLRQTLSERVKELNLAGKDVLKVVHVPFTTPAKPAVTTLKNASAERAASEPYTEKSSKDEKYPAETVPDAVSEEPGVRDDIEILDTAELMPEAVLAPEASLTPQAVLEPEPQASLTPRRIDMRTRVETTRYLLQAREAYLKNDYDAAINAIRKAIELNPLSSQAYEMLGSIYYRLGWNGMAVENWQRALNLDPTNEGLKKYLTRLSRQG